TDAPSRKAAFSGVADNARCCYDAIEVARAADRSIWSVASPSGHTFRLPGFSQVIEEHRGPPNCYLSIIGNYQLGAGG
ncbi:hypothetical protein, partial [Bradyrhizobium sp. BRP56]|uniref:hypothetical protein n=1 Tax=Bradyrhizobium sp. BRP56 TaxID=2793819 RepID=UPI001CD22889